MDVWVDIICVKIYDTNKIPDPNWLVTYSNDFMRSMCESDEFLSKVRWRDQCDLWFFLGRQMLKRWLEALQSFRKSRKGDTFEMTYLIGVRAVSYLFRRFQFLGRQILKRWLGALQSFRKSKRWHLFENDIPHWSSLISILYARKIDSLSVPIPSWRLICLLRFLSMMKGSFPSNNGSFEHMWVEKAPFFIIRNSPFVGNTP